MYIYKNKEFSSIKKLAEYCGVNEKTIVKRLGRGMSVDEACERNDLRCRYFKDKDGNMKSITQICKEQSKNKDIVNNRLKYGYSLNDALNKPKNITKQGKAIVVDGILYNSIAMALRELNMEDKEQKVRRRLKKGISPDLAFEIEKK